jgi:hypothetical protein
MKKLREYQGVTYRDNEWWYKGIGYDSAIFLLHLADWGTDDDHAALMDLKANPYDDDLLSVIEQWDRETAVTGVPRAHRDLCARLRAAFPQIDAQPSGNTGALTAADHIRALEAMGAQRIGRILSIEHEGRGGHALIGETALILPPEMTP